jgi:hypothetical protein
MEYRGKSYSIVQGPGAHIWKWKVELDEKTFKSGEGKRVLRRRPRRAG